MRSNWLLARTSALITEGPTVSLDESVDSLMTPVGRTLPAARAGADQHGTLASRLSPRTLLTQDNSAKISAIQIKTGHRLLELNAEEPPQSGHQINLLKTAPWRSVVTADRWKMTLCAADQGELFDLNTDPMEMTNLFGRPGHQDRIRWMAARLRLWQAQVGDTAPLPGV